MGNEVREDLRPKVSSPLAESLKLRGLEEIAGLPKPIQTIRLPLRGNILSSRLEALQFSRIRVVGKNSLAASSYGASSRSGDASFPRRCVPFDGKKAVFFQANCGPDSIDGERHPTCFIL
jgi:hypothetical protein